MIEVFVFARSWRATFDLSKTTLPETREYLAHRPGDFRILNLAMPNAAIWMNLNDIWGYGLSIGRRYAEFITFTQGGDPDQATQNVTFTRDHRFLSMLRRRYVLVQQGEALRIDEIMNFMPRTLLVNDYVVLRDRDRIFALMNDEAFDPRQRVVLESPPDPPPARSLSPAGTAAVVDSSTDHLTIEANLSQAAILLVTDAYSRGWRATALPGSSQGRYDVMPANYVLRAVPLAAGHHRFRMEYLPSAYRIGKWVSSVSWIVYLGACLGYARRAVKR